MANTNKERKIKLYYQNCRGLNAKLKTLRLRILLFNYDIICITETWLSGKNKEIFDSELFNESYQIYRRDRDSKTSKKKTGGGSLIAVKKSRFKNLNQLHDWQNCSTEDTWITFRDGDTKINLCCVYLPIDINPVAYKEFHKKVADKRSTCPDEVFAVVGDWNAVKFVNDVSTYTSREEVLNNCMNFCGLDQFNAFKNKFGNVLDLFFSNRLLKCYVAKNPLVTVDDAHPPISFEMLLAANTACNESEAPPTFRNFRNIDAKSVKAELNEIPWVVVFERCQNVNEMVQLFYSKINEILDKFCPRKVLITRKYPKWISKDTIKLMKDKVIYHRRFKRLKRISDKKIYDKIRRNIKNNIDKDYSRYIKCTEENVRENIKEFWNFVQSRKKNGSSLPDIMKMDNDLASNNKDVSNLFAKYFGNVYKDDNIDQNSTRNQLENPPAPILDEIWIPMYKILDKIKSLDPWKANGPDGIPTMFFKRFAETLTHPLYLIFNISLSTGMYPEDWKLAHVIPILKSGAAYDVTNYRPISLLCIISKIFESIITDQLFYVFKNLISPTQHGFFKARSTSTNLFGYTEELHRSMDIMQQTDVIYTDFSKAFDSVNHRILISKLKTAGISGKLLQWLESYITGRKQVVRVGNSLSEPIAVKSSVAQGSHLGPLLFLIFINDVRDIFEDVLHCEYADDLKFYKSITQLEDCQKLQEKIERLLDFCKTHQMKLNVSKCKVVSFTKNTNRFIEFHYSINNQQLQRESVMRDLGVFYDNKLSFNNHIEIIHNSAIKTLGFVMRTCQDFKDPKTLIMLYNSLVRSKLEYATVIWDPHYDSQIKKIERVQRKFVKQLFYRRMIQDAPEEWDYIKCCDLLTIETLEKRRIINGLSFAIKSLQQITDSSQYKHWFKHPHPAYETRHGRIFEIAKSRTESGLHSPANTLMTYLNTYCMEMDLNLQLGYVMQQVRNNVDLLYKPTI